MEEDSEEQEIARKYRNGNKLKEKKKKIIFSVGCAPKLEKKIIWLSYITWKVLSKVLI